MALSDSVLSSAGTKPAPSTHDLSGSSAPNTSTGPFLSPLVASSDCHKSTFNAPAFVSFKGDRHAT